MYISCERLIGFSSRVRQASALSPAFSELCLAVSRGCCQECQKGVPSVSPNDAKKRDDFGPSPRLGKQGILKAEASNGSHCVNSPHFPRNLCVCGPFLESPLRCTARALASDARLGAWNLGNCTVVIVRGYLISLIFSHHQSSRTLEPKSRLQLAEGLAYFGAWYLTHPLAVICPNQGNISPELTTPSIFCHFPSFSNPIFAASTNQPQVSKASASHFATSMPTALTHQDRAISPAKTQ